MKGRVASGSRTVPLVPGQAPVSKSPVLEEALKDKKGFMEREGGIRGSVSPSLL